MKKCSEEQETVTRLRASFRTWTSLDGRTTERFTQNRKRSLKWGSEARHRCYSAVTTWDGFNIQRVFYQEEWQIRLNLTRGVLFFSPVNVILNKAPAWKSRNLHIILTYSRRKEESKKIHVFSPARRTRKRRFRDVITPRLYLLDGAITPKIASSFSDKGFHSGRQ